LDKGASQRDALLLTAGQFVGISSLEPFEADQSKHLLHPGFTLAARQASKAEGNIVLDTEVGKERILLKDHAHMTMFRSHQGIRRRNQFSR
jgi:hypothetical protein